MHFGSGIVLPDLGFALQNRGSLFNKKRNHPNAYAPGKRPFQTIMPGFIKKHGEPFMAFGVMGGFMQPQGQVQIVCNMVDFGFGIQEAGDVARYFHDGSTSPRGDFVMSDGGVLQLEEECKATVENLRSRGHQVAAAPNRGGYQAILRDTSLNPGVFTYFGATEKRKDGVALGLSAGKLIGDKAASGPSQLGPSSLMKLPFPSPFLILAMPGLAMCMHTTISNEESLQAAPSVLSPARAKVTARSFLFLSLATLTKALRDYRASDRDRCVQHPWHRSFRAVG
eukprot:scaffold2342_cov368-Pinguiococcus_pyrenoidosus.AAC.12